MMRIRSARAVRRREGDGRRGATLVEFSLSFMIFVVMLVGLVEASRLIWAYTTLAHAARRGARFVMVHNGRNPATAEEVEAVVKKFTIGLDNNNVTVTPAYEDAGMSGGTTASVAVSDPFQFFASPLVFAPRGIALTATSKTTLAE